MTPTGVAEQLLSQIVADPQEEGEHPHQKTSSSLAPQRLSCTSLTITGSKLLNTQAGEQSVKTQR